MISTNFSYGLSSVKPLRNASKKTDYSWKIFYAVTRLGEKAWDKEL
jgi:hypothetical protein